MAGLLGKPLAPVLPPLGTGLVAAPLRRAGLRFPSELLNQLRYGRGLDNRRLKAAGYEYRYTTREAVQRFAEHLRLRADPPGDAGALPVRARGRGVPALESLGRANLRRTPARRSDPPALEHEAPGE